MRRPPVALLAGILAFALGTTPATAQNTGAQNVAPSCQEMAASAGWAGAPALAAATGAANRPTLEAGRAAKLALAPMPQVQFAPPPDRSFDQASFGGLVRFQVAEKGVYRVAAGSAAWLDVVADGRAVESTAHGHDRQCVGVRKMVDFPLEPGEHLLQVAGSPTQEMTVLVTRLP